MGCSRVAKGFCSVPITDWQEQIRFSALGDGGDEVRYMLGVFIFNINKSNVYKTHATQNVLQCVLQNLIVTFRATMTRSPLPRYPEMSNPPPLRKGRAT